jgi:hypothetical protein
MQGISKELSGEEAEKGGSSVKPYKNNIKFKVDNSAVVEIISVLAKHPLAD